MKCLVLLLRVQRFELHCHHDTTDDDEHPLLGYLERKKDALSRRLYEADGYIGRPFMCKRIKPAVVFRHTFSTTLMIDVTGVSSLIAPTNIPNGVPL
jgi:hypothetical protein